ncbi:hypothetical protein Gbth_038_007 [Gluconobacter thailandicus F149-1 = NBRC 100600]|uniref:hypothetical protein n=1 Tax=Gluconobacter thailandicus TaxID=257438 RepID=UPI0005514471|nr:hypothetical protein [Gluconobacter thailandicus]KXV54896.1 hypothetical protein AD946_01050 [Gluconobacter thailandicus]GAN93859.1 hypothetical protein Gbth_038_007 [Gluconobacter thailandicus F149-1 = NBRC 100600]GBR60081.1 hypothetical protein AA100600_1703 [Gluconobacter thailandicus F149-1 = NBRC 100600]GEL88579.1 hypothetical protein GTH01_29370 [Gluconobacter thailandicus F149-1 = NBRC 100600]
MKNLFFLSALIFCPLTVQAEDIHQATTRFGVVDGSTSIIKFRGKVVSPEIDGNFVEKIAESGNADYLLLTQEGGRYCDAMYLIAKVTSKGVTSQKEFGNCAEPKTHVIPNKSIVLDFPRYQKDQEITVVYDIPTGTLTQNGKPIK